MKIKPLIFLLFVSLMITATAQDKISLNDYERAIGYLYKNYHNKKLFNAYINPHWFADSSGLWFAHHAPEKISYRKIEFSDLTISDLFDHNRLAQILSDSLGKEVDADSLPINSIEYKNPDELLISVKGTSYLLNTKSYTLKEAPEISKPNDDEQISPDEHWIAFSKDYNLYLKSAKTGETKQLSSSGRKGYEYASWFGWADIIRGENGERPKHFGVNWSPDSKWVSASICDLRSAQKMYLLDWSIDSLYRPQLLSYYRGSPGDTGLIYMEPVFFNLTSGKEVKTGLPRSTHINDIEVSWSERPGKVYLMRQNRGYKDIHFYSFNLETEVLDTLYSEYSETNINNTNYRFAEKSGLMFFISEKSGWRQIYSLNLKTKEVKAVTHGSFVVNDFVRIDEAKKKIYFMASGLEEGRNPYFQGLYSISFDGNKMRLLSPENRHHIVSISPDGKYFVDNFSTVRIPTKTVLRKTKNGEIIATLGEADTTLLKGWSPPEVFSTTARDGKTSIYGAIWKPDNFDATKCYPVIEYSYTGPHTQVFPKDFSSALRNQSFAELGFVVVVVDGLGSSGRSKEFHNYSYKNLGGNLEDHVRAIKQLGRQYSWIDTTRVGIFGHSAGGYDAGHAVLAYPDFYKVAVASSGDHDHRMEKAWWPEMYMGWPVDSSYHLQSNITMAGNLKGKLLLVHGGIDENVNPSATFKFAEALIKADKAFDMLILPNQRHGYTGKHRNYFTKVRWNYFIENLRGVEPIWDIDL